MPNLKEACQLQGQKGPDREKCAELLEYAADIPKDVVLPTGDRNFARMLERVKKETNHERLIDSFLERT